MDHRAITRRQFVQNGALLALATPSLLRASAADAFADLPPIFRPSDPPISDAWRRRLESDHAKPLVRLLLNAATDRLADPLPGAAVKPVLATGVADPAIQD